MLGACLVPMLFANMAYHTIFLSTELKRLLNNNSHNLALGSDWVKKLQISLMVYHPAAYYHIASGPKPVACYIPLICSYRYRISALSIHSRTHVGTLIENKTLFVMPGIHVE